MKTKMTKLCALFLAILMCMSFAACDNSKDPTDDTNESDSVTDEITTDEETTDEETTDEVTTEEVTTEDPPTPPVELEVAWHLGYVASSTNQYATPNAINPTGGMYSYSDVITIPKAGTTITFADDNTNSNGDTNFASNAAYVISSWKKSGDNWVIDLDRANFPGGSTTDNPIVKSNVSGVLTYSYTTTYDNENIRLCYRSGQSDSFTPAKYPTVYSEYNKAPGTIASNPTLDQWIELSKKDYYNEALECVTINALGDSYFAGQGLPLANVWLGLLAKKYDMDMNNYGIGGSTISDYTNNNPMCNRFNRMENNNPHIVLIEGGRNDYNQQTPLGTAGSTDTKTFIGALNVIVDGVQAKYPYAMIVIISPWNFPSDKTISRQNYVDAMKAVAEAQGTYFIDASNSQAMGVDMSSSTFRSKYCIASGDVSHLNGEGMKLVMPKFEKYLADFYTEFLAKVS